MEGRTEEVDIEDGIRGINGNRKNTIIKKYAVSKYLSSQVLINTWLFTHTINMFNYFIKAAV